MYEINRMHEVYGPVIRVNPDEIHVKDPEWYDTLYSTGNATRDNYPPSAHFGAASKANSWTEAHYLSTTAEMVSADTAKMK